MDDKVLLRRQRVAEAEDRVAWLESQPNVDQKELELAYRSLEFRKKMLATASRRDPRKGLRLVSSEGVQLLRRLVKEVVIAGEVEISDLYSEYSPDDPKEYLGMIMGADDAGGGEGGDEGGDDGDIVGNDATPGAPDTSEEE